MTLASATATAVCQLQCSPGGVQVDAEGKALHKHVQAVFGWLHMQAIAASKLLRHLHAQRCLGVPVHVRVLRPLACRQTKDEHKVESMQSET